MNQSQRNFLIEKIKENLKIQIKSLESNEIEYPNLSNYLLHEVMSNRVKLQSQEYIQSVIKKKALNAKPGEAWMSKDRWGSSEEKITFNPADIFIIPESYAELLKEAKENNSKIREQVRQLSIQSESLIVRIQLASDKTLQKMINEVDDMGDISLMESKIKLISL